MAIKPSNAPTEETAPWARLGLILAVVVGAAWLCYPLNEKITLARVESGHWKFSASTVAGIEDTGLSSAAMSLGGLRPYNTLPSLACTMCMERSGTMLTERV